MLPKEAWAKLIPHAGSMVLLDAVVSWDATALHAMGERRTEHDHPLCSPRGLHAVHLIEYGAQAAAVHSALLAASRGDACMRPGRLVSVRDAKFAVEYITLRDGRLDVCAECIVADPGGAKYMFTVRQLQQPLASGCVTVMYTGD